MPRSRPISSHVACAWCGCSVRVDSASITHPGPHHTDNLGAHGCSVADAFRFEITMQISWYHHCSARCGRRIPPRCRRFSVVARAMFHEVLVAGGELAMRPSVSYLSIDIECSNFVDELGNFPGGGAVRLVFEDGQSQADGLWMRDAGHDCGGEYRYAGVSEGIPENISYRCARNCQGNDGGGLQVGLWLTAWLICCIVMSADHFDKAEGTIGINTRSAATMMARVIATAPGGPSMITWSWAWAWVSTPAAMSAGGRVITGQGGALRTDAQSVALACGSASTSSTFLPCRCIASVTLIANVDLPTPPFCPRKAMFTECRPLFTDIVFYSIIHICTFTYLHLHILTYIINFVFVQQTGQGSKIR